MRDEPVQLNADGAGSPIDRRRFIRASSFAAAFAAVGSCSSSTEPGAGGRVTIRVEGLEGTAAGSIALVDPGTGAPLSPSVALSTPVAGVSTGTATGLANGSYRVRYSPPANHLLLTTPDFFDVTITPATNETFTFEVRGYGRLVITVTGIESGASAGSLSVAPMPAGPSDTSLVLPAPTAGSSSVAANTHATGAFRVTHTPPANHAHVGPSVRDVTVPLGGEVTASFTVEQTVVPPVLAFESNWDTALGTGTVAVSDGGRWTLFNNTNNKMTVVAAAALGFPTTNCLRIDYNDAFAVARGVTKQNGWSIPPIGGYLARRIIFRNDIPASAYPIAGHHPVQSAYQAGCCPFAAEWFFNSLTETTFQLEIATLADGVANPRYRWRLGSSLTVGTVYQVEERYQRIGADTWNLDIRVWNGNGTTQLFASNHFSDSNNNQGLLSQTPRPTIIMPASCNQSPCLEHLMLVDQGQPFTGSSALIYYGGVAVRISADAQWVGPLIG